MPVKLTFNELNELHQLLPLNHMESTNLRDKLRQMQIELLQDKVTELEAARANWINSRGMQYFPATRLGDVISGVNDGISHP